MKSSLRFLLDVVMQIEPTETAEAGWLTHLNECAQITLFPTADSQARLVIWSAD